MLVSRNWLQRFFTESLPDTEVLEDALTFHSSEVESVRAVNDDAVFDVTVLPDKSAWLLSHRGVARELAAITGCELTNDPLSKPLDLRPVLARDDLIVRSDERCDYYAAALLSAVQVGPSPIWMVELLTAIGQRSINNVVDATNFILFSLGQPLHAFDAGKLTGGPASCRIEVRAARAGETITVLTGETYELTPADMLIVDAGNDAPIGIAGVKGGLAAAVDEHTTDILIESAHFDRVAVRRTAKRLGLRTDASARFENGVPRALAPYGLQEVTQLIVSIAGATVCGYQCDGQGAEERPVVTVSLEKINNVLGLSLTDEDVTSTLERFGYHLVADAESYHVTPPMERDDLTIPEAVIEEIGRLYGLHHIEAVPPEVQPVSEINERHYYAEVVRTALVHAGFSEIMTSSFRSEDTVQLANALASDKQYLRSRLTDNLVEALDRNAPYRDLLGVPAIMLFEIGTVFGPVEESYHLAIAVRSGVRYKAKHDAPRLEAAMAAVTRALGTTINFQASADGVVECDLGALIKTLPAPTAYEPVPASRTVRFAPFSPYPPVARDIAIFVSPGIESSAAQAVIDAAAGALRVRTTLFDEFSKDGRQSYAFRLVFQSMERTLTDTEVNHIMERVYAAVIAEGWEVR